MGLTLQLREVDEAAIDAVLAVKILAARAAYEPLVGRPALDAWLTKRGTAGYIASRIADPACHYLMAETDHGIVGAGCVIATDAGAYLTDVYCFPAGHGVGSALTEALLTHADQTIPGDARCYVIAENAPALAFFGRFGFVETERSPNPELPGMLVEMHR